MLRFNRAFTSFTVTALVGLAVGWFSISPAPAQFHKAHTCFDIYCYEIQCNSCTGGTWCSSTDAVYSFFKCWPIGGDCTENSGTYGTHLCEGTCPNSASCSCVYNKCWY